MLCEGLGFMAPLCTKSTGAGKLLISLRLAIYREIQSATQLAGVIQQLP